MSDLDDIEPPAPISLVEKRSEPSEVVMERLRELYARAKAGEILAIKYAMVDSNGIYNHGTVHDDITKAQSYALDIGVMQLAFRVQQENYEEEGRLRDGDKQVDPETDEPVDPDDPHPEKG